MVAMHGSSHGIRALLPVGFDDVVNALHNYKHASNVYFTVLGTSPRVAVFIGGKFFVRTLGFITVVTVVIDNGSYTEVRIVTHTCLLYTSPSPRDRQKSRMPSSA